MGDVGLVMTNITKDFPGVKALDTVSLTVRYSEVLTLVGENGAGKSTLMKVLSGVYLPDAGTMTLNGKPYRPAGPRDAAQLGIALIHQELSLLPNLSLAENVMLGRFPVHHGLLAHKELLDTAQIYLERVGISLDPRTITGGCSVAIQQQVEIAKALSQKPRILVFDEPTASLGDEETEVLFGITESLKADGVGIVWITHRLSEISRIADRIVVMRDGAVVANWDEPDVPITEIIRAMVGRPVDDIYPPLDVPTDEVVLSVRGLTRPGEFEDVSFDVHAGEILGIAGLVGAGRSELVETICGARVATAGTVNLEGRPLHARSPGDAVQAGLVLIPEDRKTSGLAQRLTVEDNVGLPKRGTLKGLVNNWALRRDVVEAIDAVSLKGGLDQLAETLSGGNQQKGVIAKWLTLSPKMVIFDEPTRGIDVGARQAIYRIMHDLAARGVGIVAVSSDLPEVLGISHRIAVISNGRLTGILDRSEATSESVMALAVS